MYLLSQPEDRAYQRMGENMTLGVPMTTGMTVKIAMCIKEYAKGMDCSVAEVLRLFIYRGAVATAVYKPNAEGKAAKIIEDAFIEDGIY